jgi:GNAT superfamily N-acetyltransferase
MTEFSPGARTTIRALDAAEAEARLEELAGILVDAVAHGASVNFMAAFTSAQAREWWHGQLGPLANKEKLLLVGEQNGRLVATVTLAFAPQPNAPHRAEIGKMLVHSSLRRQGLGRRLLEAAEAAARARGRTLLLLDTEADSAGEKLYRSCGWTAIGRVPGHSFRPNGQLAATTLFYKQLDSIGAADQAA